MSIQRAGFGLFLLSLLLLAACSGEQSPPSTLQKTALQLNWVPEPEFGGYYAARERGAFVAEGLDLEIRPGGAQSPVEQMVAAGQVEFGITSADSLLMARDRAADLVAIYAAYQSFPEGIMVHASRGLKSMAEVFQGGTLGVIPGTPFLKLLEREYGLGKMKVVPHDNNIAPFLHDPRMAQQCFISSEPIVARFAPGRTPRSSCSRISALTPTPASSSRGGKPWRPIPSGSRPWCVPFAGVGSFFG